MKTTHSLFRTACAAVAGAIAAAAASATTITFSGTLTDAVLGSFAVGDTWQLTVVIPDPLTDTSGGAEPGLRVYTPTSMSMAIGGVVHTADFNFGSRFEGGHGYQGRYGNGVMGLAFDGVSVAPQVVVGLGSSSMVTTPEGLLLPGVPLASFEDNRMWYYDVVGYSFYVGGVVTAYSVDSGNPVPDAPMTGALVVAGLATVALLRRRF